MIDPQIITDINTEIGAFITANGSITFRTANAIITKLEDPANFYEETIETSATTGIVRFQDGSELDLDITTSPYVEDRESEAVIVASAGVSTKTSEFRDLIIRVIESDAFNTSETSITVTDIIGIMDGVAYGGSLVADINNPIG